MIRHPRTSGGSARRARRCSCAGSCATAELRRKVWPDYTFGCKRVLFSSDFLPALQRPNVELGDRADRAARRRPASSRRRPRARGRLHHLRHRLPGDRLHVPDGDRRRATARTLRDAWAEGAARAPGHHGARASRRCFSCTARTRTPRAARSSSTRRRRRPTSARRSQLGAARGAAPDVDRRSRRATARCRRASPAPRGRAATPGTATTSGRIVTNWPGYMREYARATARSTRRVQCAQAERLSAERPVAPCRGDRSRCPRPGLRRSVADPPVTVPLTRTPLIHSTPCSSSCRCAAARSPPAGPGKRVPARRATSKPMPVSVTVIALRCGRARRSGASGAARRATRARRARP